MEPEAANCFLELMKTTHKNPSLAECGLYVDPDFPFIGASPDRIFSCDCCEPACVEIKCPCINHTTPYDNDIKLPYLIKKGDYMTLNENHGYYTQVLMQLGVTRMTHGYFMVWTVHGHFVQHIHTCFLME